MPAGIKLGIRALLWDYMLIMIYLIIIATIMIAIFLIFFQGIPQLTEIQSQVIAFLTTVLPVTAYFSRKEASEPFAAFGKKKAGIRVEYLRNPLIGSIMRNISKFLPWQFGHMAVIDGMYNGFGSTFVLVFYGLSIALPVIYIGMVWLRKDSRHISDFIAGSQVVIVENR